MEVTDRDIENLRRISEQVFGDKEYVEVEQVKDTQGDVMVEVHAAGDETLGTRSAFAADNLRKYHENGYVAVAVGGGDERHSAWFERADSIEFGAPEPDGEYEIRDGWLAVVGEKYVVLHHTGDVVAHVPRDGWTLDDHVLHAVLPSRVTEDLLDIGFEKGNVELDP